MKTIKWHEIISYIFIIGMASIPFIQWPSLADPSLLSRQIYLGFLMLLGLILYKSHAAETLHYLPKPLIYLSITWLTSSVLGIFYAKNIPELWYTTSKIALYISAIWLFYLLLESGSISLKQVSAGISVASFIALLILSIELVEKQEAGTALWEKKNLYALQTMFGHKNLYASFQLLCIPFVFNFVQSKHWIIKNMAIGLLILIFLSIGLIQTKSVILGIIIAIAIAIPLGSAYVWKEEKRKFNILMFAYTSVLLLLGLLIYLKQEMFTLLLNNDTLKERILLWKNSLQMIKESFPFGVGAGNWQIYFPKYGLQEFMQTNYLISDGYTTFQRPHNDFLWVLSELGVIGFTAYVGLFVYVIHRSIKQLKHTVWLQEKTIQLVFICTLIAYVFVAMVDFPLERNEHQFLLAILLSVGIGSNQNKSSEVSHQKPYILVVLACLISGTLAYSVNRYTNEAHSKKMIQAHMQGNWNLMASEASKINKKMYSIDNFSIPVAWYQGIAQYGLNQPALAKKYFEEAYLINPYQIHVLNNMAGMNEQAGNHEMALQYYDELLAISPTQPDAILNKSAVLYNQKEYEKAMACLYQFKHDERNLQYLQFLKAIGYAYLKEELEKDPTSNNQTAFTSISDPNFIVYYFKWNKEKKHPFSQLKWPQ